MLSSVLSAVLGALSATVWAFFAALAGLGLLTGAAAHLPPSCSLAATAVLACLLAGLALREGRGQGERWWW